MSSPTIPALDEGAADGTTRRRFLTYLVAGPTLAVGVRYGLLDGVAQALPGTPEIADAEDLGDFLIQVQKPTESLLIVLVAHGDGTVSCALPRMEVGQGLTTSTA
ncbi:MAG: isoquinoline 1-oxidoreductase, partial [Frankiales bacterium]|nr:isoquinoline 1-oxidoreductase [Frankiales bacterium]